MGISQLCPPAQMVDPELVSRLHTEGFSVRAWGVQTEYLMEQVVRAGVNGMTVNFPDKLVRYLENMNHPWE